jgi:hypothetical protein
MLGVPLAATISSFFGETEFMRGKGVNVGERVHTSLREEKMMVSEFIQTGKWKNILSNLIIPNLACLHF